MIWRLLFVSAESRRGRVKLWIREEKHDRDI